MAILASNRAPERLHLSLALDVSFVGSHDYAKQLQLSQERPSLTSPSPLPHLTLAPPSPFPRLSLAYPSPLPRLSLISAPPLFLLDEAVSQIGDLRSAQDLGSHDQPENLLVEGREGRKIGKRVEWEEGGIRGKREKVEWEEGGERCESK